MRVLLPKIKILAWMTFFSFCGLVAVLSALYLYLAPTLPEADSLKQVQLQTPLRVFSSDGALIGEFGEKRRNPVSFQDIPRDLINAFLAAEDDQFYQHNGVDIKGLLRAASQLLKSGSIQSGGSTITMQVARNFFLTRQQTFSRKLNEIFLAIQIENSLTKNEIIELYANKIYLGNRAYGVEAAAQVYYGKPLQDLSLAQLAMIAGLPKAPSAYNPIANPSRALIRRNWILRRMKSLDMIDERQFEASLQEVDNAEFHGSKLDFQAPYVSEIARQKALSEFGTSAYEKGYKVYTTVDSNLQKAAQRAVLKGVLAYDQRHGYRGPEGKLTPIISKDAEEVEVTDSEEGAESVVEESMPSISDETLKHWKSTIDQKKIIGDFIPAVVIHTDDNGATIVIKGGEEHRLEWKGHLAEVRPYIDENRRGSKPSSTSELLSTGDVIRIRKDETGKPRLSQIPDAEAALVSLDPNNGAVKAVVGGLNFDNSHFNRATQAKRQPGSNFKPLIYTRALELGYSAASLINDAPIVFNDRKLETTWRPENAGGKFYGPTRLRQALYNSRNLVSIRLLRDMGISSVTPSLRRFGVATEELPKDLSLALGSHAMTPLKVAESYAVFANGGYRVEPYFVDRIEDIKGNVIYQSEPAIVCEECGKQIELDSDADISLLEDALKQQLLDDNQSVTTTSAERVMSPQINYLMDSMLKDVIQKGTARRAKKLKRNDIAGKTGTTNGPTDAWFSGYQRNLVATAWLGFDDNSMLGRREYGGTSALPIWIDFMAVALKDEPHYQRPLPEGLVSVKIDPKTGERSAPGDPRAIFELFRLENTPSRGNTDKTSGDFNGNDPLLPDDLF